MPPTTACPPKSNFIFLALRISWPWPCVGLGVRNPYRLQPPYDPAAISLPPGPQHRRYQHRMQSISNTCTGGRASPLSPVPTSGPEHLRYLHWEWSISRTYTGSEHLRCLRCLHRDRGRSTCWAERPWGTAGPVQGKAERPFPPVFSRGKAPMKERERLYFSSSAVAGKGSPEAQSLF